MVFERGAAARGMLTMALTARFAVGQRLPEDILILVMDRSNLPSRAYFVHGAVVRRCSWSDLDAMSGALLIERFEITYETLECL